MERTQGPSVLLKGLTGSGLQGVRLDLSATAPTPDNISGSSQEASTV